MCSYDAATGGSSCVFYIRLPDALFGRAFGALVSLLKGAGERSAYSDAVDD